MSDQLRAFRGTPASDGTDRLHAELRFLKTKPVSCHSTPADPALPFVAAVS
jgi:hypothetical protein